MKTRFAFSLAIFVSLVGAIAQQPNAAQEQKKTFFQRMFGPDAQVNSASNGPVPKGDSPVPKEDTWHLYTVEQRPAGTSIGADDALRLAIGEHVAEVKYLIGDYKVTASGGNRAVLRSMNKDLKVRVIAEYSAPAAPPAEGTELTLDQSRGLLIQRVLKTADGPLSVYVRDISQP